MYFCSYCLWMQLYFAKGDVTHANFSAKKKIENFEFLTIYIFSDAIEVIKAIKEIKDWKIKNLVKYILNVSCPFKKIKYFFYFGPRRLNGFELNLVLWKKFFLNGLRFCDWLKGFAILALNRGFCFCFFVLIFFFFTIPCVQHFFLFPWNEMFTFLPKKIVILTIQPLLVTCVRVHLVWCESIISSVFQADTNDPTGSNGLRYYNEIRGGYGPGCPRPACIEINFGSQF